VSCAVGNSLPGRRALSAIRGSPTTRIRAGALAAGREDETEVEPAGRTTWGRTKQGKRREEAATPTGEGGGRRSQLRRRGRGDAVANAGTRRMRIEAARGIWDSARIIRNGPNFVQFGRVREDNKPTNNSSLFKISAQLNVACGLSSLRRPRGGKLPAACSNDAGSRPYKSNSDLF
jgi:hypothetical protein